MSTLRLEPGQKEIWCPVCKEKKPIMLMRDPLFSEHYAEAQSRGGRLIMEIWPQAEYSAEEREQLMTGICSNECWDAQFPSEDEEDEDEA
jgi:hypothetical protein